MERRVLGSILAFSAVASALGLLGQLTIDTAHGFDRVGLPLISVGSAALATALTLGRISTGAAYRWACALAAAYLAGFLVVGLIRAPDQVAAEAILYRTPPLALFVYLLAFLGWEARRALLVSGAVVLGAIGATVLVLLAGLAPRPSLATAVDFSLSFCAAHIVFIGLLALFGRARSQVDQATRQLSALGELARTDSLTGALNRRGFEEQLVSEATRSTGRACRLALIMIDLDHFKRVNDRWGHPVGDQVLKEFAALLTRLVRTSDAIGRWGGEEFVVLMRRPTPGEALFLADRLRRAIEEHEFPVVQALTASFGVAELAEDDELTHLLAQADDALYRAKASGRNRTCASRKMMEAMAGGEADREVGATS